MVKILRGSQCDWQCRWTAILEDDDAAEEEEQTIKPQERERERERERRQFRSTVVDRARERGHRRQRSQRAKWPPGLNGQCQRCRSSTGQLEQVRGQRGRERGRANEDKGNRANSLDNTPQVVGKKAEAIHYTAGILEVRVGRVEEPGGGGALVLSGLQQQQFDSLIRRTENKEAKVGAPSNGKNSLECLQPDR